MSAKAQTFLRCALCPHRFLPTQSNLLLISNGVFVCDGCRRKQAESISRGGS